MVNPVFNPSYQTTAPPGTRPIPPVEESMRGENFAYRGSQSHGVRSDPTYDYDDTDFEKEVGTEYVEPKEPETPPIPVRIVQEERRERRSWDVDRTFMDTQRAYELLGYNESRYEAVIYNAGPDQIFVSPSVSVSAATGFPVSSGGSFTVKARDAVYATVESGNTATAHVSWEFVRPYR